MLAFDIPSEILTHPFFINNYIQPNATSFQVFPQLWQMVLIKYLVGIRDSIVAIAF